jgi:hypothetical protein
VRWILSLDGPTFSLYARAAHYCARDAHPIKLLPDLVLVEFEQPIMGSDWPPDVYVDRAPIRALLRYGPTFASRARPVKMLDQRDCRVTATPA